MVKQRVLSGIQPSGDLTIGNYLGAIKQWVEEQSHYDSYFCVVDLHALTVPQDPLVLQQKIREVAALYIACGIDPKQAAIFVQSQVSAHSELAWLLTCFAPIGWLNRMTQFKDKSAKQDNQESISAGLLNYPTLMAADILLYHAAQVPVGDDQRQHLEYTRDLAQRFNHIYGDIFTIPDAMIPKEGARIMGLDTPNMKMSKSEASDYHAIYLLDPPNRIKKKLMRAVTDNFMEIRFSDEPERAGVNNLLTIYQGFTGSNRSDIENEFAGRGYGDLKKAVVEVVTDSLAPIQARYAEITGESGELDMILQDGKERAEAVANATLRDVQNAVGLIRA